jgi:hypothetical protein
MTELEKILDDFGKKLVTDVRQSWDNEKKKKAAKYGTPFNPNSRLNASMSYEVTFRNGSLFMVFSMDDTYVFPEDGRKPAGVSKEGQRSLAEWVRRNGLKFNITQKAKTTTRKIKNKTVKRAYKQMSMEQAIKGVVYVISRKIKERGYDGTRFYSKVINDGRIQKLQQEIFERFNEDIQIVLRTN